MIRIRNNEGLPIEVLDSLRLLGRARFEYLDAIAEYNASQFELYVALGQPPANALARRAPLPNQPNQPAPLLDVGTEESQPQPPQPPNGQN